MLVLKRREGECVQIGEVIVHVKRCQSNAVYLAIDAPQEIRIVRPDAKCKTPRVTRLTLYEPGGRMVGYFEGERGEMERAAERHKARGRGYRAVLA